MSVSSNLVHIYTPGPMKGRAKGSIENNEPH